MSVLEFVGIDVEGKVYLDTKSMVFVVVPKLKGKKAVDCYRAILQAIAPFAEFVATQMMSEGS